MKIKGKALSMLHDALHDANGDAPTLADYESRGLSEKRWLWDLYWRIPNDKRREIEDQLDQDHGPRGWHGDHLQTAIKRFSTSN